MVHGRLRGVCEERRGEECGYTKATPGCGKRVEGRRTEYERGGRGSQTCRDTPALGILLIRLPVLTLHILTGPSWR